MTSSESTAEPAEASAAPSPPQRSRADLERTASTEGVSIVIPAYNEEGGAAPTLEELLALLEREVAPKVDYEVIVVDDGSKDRTCEIIEQFVGERLRLVRHEQNQGYGAAIKTGIRHARHPWVMITDADGTYPAEHIPELLDNRDGHAMVVGARIGQSAHIPLIRRPPKWVLRKLASWMSRQNIPDLNSGLRVFRKDVADKYRNILPNAFSYTVTITLVTFSAGHQVKYVPINYNRRAGKSKIRPIADTINFLKLIVRTILYFDPLRVFLPVAILFILGAVGTGVGSYALTGRIMDVTTVLLFVTGIHMLALGMIADMLNRRIP
jgi:glycosyltransferase involved in cell wall biosynthesis